MGSSTICWVTQEESYCWRMGRMKVPIEIRRHLKIDKWVRQLHVINGAVYYRVSYSQMESRLGG